LILASRPAYGDDVKRSTHRGSELPQHHEAIFVQMSIIEDNAPGLQFEDRILKLRGISTRVEKTPAFLHELLYQEGLPDARFPDENQVTCNIAQTFEVVIAADNGNLWRRTSRGWEPGQSPRLPGHTEQISSPLRTPVQQTDEIAPVMHLVQSNTELFLKMPR
jgi:hypothetical protein